jgi:hypothetical protein
VGGPPGCPDCKRYSPGARYGCDHYNYWQMLKAALDAKGLKRIGSGGFRATWLSKDGKWVYKVPYCSSGYDDNIIEYRSWQDRAYLMGVRWQAEGEEWKRVHTPIGHRICRCKLAPSGILVMEYVRGSGRHDEFEIVQDDRSMEDEREVMHALMNMDDAQGGVCRDGRFRVYDYSGQTEILDPGLSNMMAL